MSQLTTSPRSAQTLTAEHAQHFLKHLFPEPRAFAVRLWDGSLFPAQDEARFTIVINSPGALRRMFRIPLELSLGEAYVRGDFDIEGDLVAAITLIKSFPRLALPDALALLRLWFQLPTDPISAEASGRSAARLSGARHSKARDRDAIQYHYDVGNEFYALWLDKRLVYSCAYFPTGAEDLDTAQERKLDHSCRKLRLKPGETLLDIGCGWGGMVIHAAQHYGVNALGVTLSEQQYQLANERIAEAGLSDRVTVKLLDYRDLSGEQFDKIVSIGMFEHVGQRKLGEYFGHIYSLLRPGGLFLNHGISVNPYVARLGQESIWSRLIERFIVQPSSFTQRYVFPDGELVPVSQINLIAEQHGFEVRDVENLREHYAMTLRHWVKRLEASRDKAAQLTSKATYRVWKLYMSAAVAGFELGDLNVNQTLLARLAAGRSNLPLSRADLYAA